MKKLVAFSLAACALSMAACKKDKTTTTPPTATDTTYIRGTISSSTTWNKNTVYVLRGYVYVDAPAELTIEAGTKILSYKDSAGVLLIYKNAKIHANGTAAAPIVFTSGEATPQPGDLGGVVLVGNAPGNGNHATLEGGVDAAHNQFGGANSADNSGELKYVRIEYAGKAVNPGDEVNALSLYAVGNGTTIDYVQSVRGLDDAFEFFGGTVNAKHLIAYNCADDDFDFDDGFSGMVQYGISIKDPLFTDNKGGSGDLSNNFEWDNAVNKPYNVTPRTHPVIANFTAIGPNGAAGTSNDYGYGMRLRRGTSFDIANCIVIGAKKGFLNLRDSTTIRLYTEGSSMFHHCVFQSSIDTATIDNQSPYTYSALAIQSIITTRDGSTITPGSTAGGNAIGLTAPYNNATPNLMPTSSSAALTGADWSSSQYSNSFFEKVNFVGAMGTTDWTSGWAVWNR